MATKERKIVRSAPIEEEDELPVLTAKPIVDDADIAEEEDPVTGDGATEDDGEIDSADLDPFKDKWEE